jgi:hypothetical protein
MRTRIDDASTNAEDNFCGLLDPSTGYRREEAVILVSQGEPLPFGR